MGQALDEGEGEGTAGRTRALAKLAEPLHAVTYYTRELTDLRSHGYRGWWHGYFAYRPAPLGEVGAATVTALFYNFAPRMVERAVPGVWSIRSAADTVEWRRSLVAAALERIFGDGRHDGPLATAAALLRRGLEGCDVAGRPLFAAYTELPWPDDDALAVWHGCTLLRELRGDSHNVALAAAEVDGVMSHVLMAGRGHGNRPTILAIRGWTEGEWDEAVASLTERGWTEPDGTLTVTGNEARSAIETHTDRLASAPLTRLGPGAGQQLLDALEPLVAHLKATGEVSGRWPPDHLMKRDHE
jgi:hypothetical protein